MTPKQGIVAQMSTYPMDVRHVEYLLPHQIRSLRGMVDRIVVTIDTHQSQNGRYRVDNFNQNLDRLRQLVGDARRTYPGLQVLDVDYSESTQRAVARYFFDLDSIPIKAWDGGPFYSYFYGLYAADAQYVMHFDGDIIFGGGSKTWVRDAITCMERRPDVLVTAPFPGPPRADGKIFGHGALERIAVPESATSELSYRHTDVSTRVFMIDINRFKEKLGAFPCERPSATQQLKSRLLGNVPEAREAEVILSNTIRRSGLCRIDMLGRAPGFWSLHPPYRSEEFYRRLPEIISAVEGGSVPEGQRGHYDLNDTMVDWTQARADNHWRRRYLKMIRRRLAGVA
jgi:hypothetical protein